MNSIKTNRWLYVELMEAVERGDIEYDDIAFARTIMERMQAEFDAAGLSH